MPAKKLAPAPKLTPGGDVPFKVKLPEAPPPEMSQSGLPQGSITLADPNLPLELGGIYQYGPYFVKLLAYENGGKRMRYTKLHPDYRGGVTESAATSVSVENFQKMISKGVE